MTTDRVDANADIPGDGIGEETAPEGVRALEAAAMTPDHLGEKEAGSAIVKAVAGALS